MHMIRIDYATGQNMTLVFREATGAQEALESLRGAKPGSRVVLADDNGHHAVLAVDGIIMLLLTDLGAEVEGAALVRSFVAHAEGRAMPHDPGLAQQQAGSPRTAFSM